MPSLHSEEINRDIFDSLKIEHQKFLINLVYKGMNQTNAYLDVYPESSTEAAKVGASRLLTNANISEAYFMLKAELKERAQVDTDWTTNVLIELINEARTEDKVDYNAIKGLVNEVHRVIGGHAPEKKDLTSGGKPIKNDWHIHPVTTDKNGNG